MDISLFLAQAIGLYMLILGFSVIVRRKDMRRILDDFAGNASHFFIIGQLVLILGILLVLTHNVWEASWRVVITIFAWLTLLKGILYLLQSVSFMRGILKWFNRHNWYIIWGIVAVLVGLYLMSIGFGWGVF